MSSYFSKPQQPGQLRDAKSKSIGRVNTFGQIAVRFHKTPHGLEHWFENAQKDFSNNLPIRKKHVGTNMEKHNLPPPRLHIAIHICGSRGDVQPFVPIAKLLQGHGHRVRICTHPAFKDFVVRTRLPHRLLAEQG